MTKKTAKLKTPNLDDLTGQFPEIEFLCLEPRDELDEAIVGVVERFGLEPILCYDLGVLLKCYEKQGMTEEDAREFFDFNVIGAWVGDKTPCFMTRLDKDKKA